MNELEKIIENAKVTPQMLNRRLLHPIYKTEFKPRPAFSVLKKCTNDFFNQGVEPRMIGLSGLRGTGKTTLLWQTAAHIYSEITQNIYFFNVETLVNLNISIFDFYLHIRNNNEFLDKPVILLFDEVHADPNWSKSLKILYDELRIAFIVATGSSALLLQTTADLATRMLIQHIFPLSFTEYLSIKQNIDMENVHNFQEQLKNILFFSKDNHEIYNGLQNLTEHIKKYLNRVNDIEVLVKNYIEYHNITRFCLYNDHTFVASEISALYQRVIHEDIPKITNELIQLNSEKILLRLAASDEINTQSLSQVIGVSQEKINETIDILAKAELLNIIYPFGGIDSKLNKTKKAFFMSPSIRMALLLQVFNEVSNEYLAKLYEDVVVMYLKRLFSDSILSFSSYTKEQNPDFIIETCENPILLEVGINKKTTRQISKSKIVYRYGIVINTKINTISLKDNTVFLPLNWFLLL